MKVLVATTETQGEQPGDYFCTVEGELVTPLGGECDSPRTCGCGRGLVGLASARGTTTAVVVDRPELTVDDLYEAVYDHLDRGGWIALIDDDDDVDVDELLDAHVACIQAVCAAYPVGTVVCRWGSRVFNRISSAAA